MLYSLNLNCRTKIQRIGHTTKFFSRKVLVFTIKYLLLHRSNNGMD